MPKPTTRSTKNPHDETQGTQKLVVERVHGYPHDDISVSLLSIRKVTMSRGYDGYIAALFGEELCLPKEP